MVKEGHKRASVHTRTKTEAQNRARQIIKNQGGGDLRIKDEKGHFIDSDTVKGPRQGSASARVEGARPKVAGPSRQYHKFSIGPP